MDSNFNPLFSLLPQDILNKILSLLNNDSKAFRTVCKAFNNVDLVNRTHLKVLRPEFLPGLLTKFTKIQSLDVSACAHFNNSTVSILLSYNMNWVLRLKSINLSRSPGLTYIGLEMLVRECLVLENVDVSYCVDFGDREAAALSFCCRLKELKIDRCLGVSDVGLAKIAVGCKNLESVSLKWCFEITDLGIDLLCNKCLDLKNLDISYMKVTNEALRSIANVQRLELLAMVACRRVDDGGMHYIGNGCPSLRVLDVSRCDKLSSFSLEALIKGHHGLLQLHASYFSIELPVFLLHVDSFSCLTVIRVDGARVTDYILEFIGDNFTNLIDISLGKCEGVTDSGIIKLVSSCMNLKVVNLTCCKLLTDSAIKAIADSCRRILCLKLECCNLLTERSLDHLGSNCLLLEELDLTDCSGVNDIGLGYLSKCSELLNLKLGLCGNISDKGVSYISSNCSKILELDLYKCSGIGDSGLAAISSGCKKIKKLNLSYCTLVTDRGIGCLGRLGELSDLEMRGLSKVSGPGLIVLAAGCKRLAELDLKHCEHVHDCGFWGLAQTRNLQQINLSCCRISDVGLCLLMSNLTRLQDAKLVNLVNVSAEGLELALRASCFRLKKLKLHASVRHRLSYEIVSTLRATGCKIRWD
ncbi:hypothetical protein LIER_35418 [Lithospermum erythrorhizon]|uniref:F-box/LRR-repeat protein 15-like leucin rich repeat domain-containing protein n=1 Tax=Lithospermum erythrorhizon TaxID=34254 RepID=A0AAV3NQE7_LITER